MATVMEEFGTKSQWYGLIEKLSAFVYPALSSLEKIMRSAAISVHRLYRNLLARTFLILGHEIPVGILQYPLGYFEISWALRSL